MLYPSPGNTLLALGLFKKEVEFFLVKLLLVVVDQRPATLRQERRQRAGVVAHQPVDVGRLRAGQESLASAMAHQASLNLKK